jgi:hypothetical protein
MNFSYISVTNYVPLYLQHYTKFQISKISKMFKDDSNHKHEKQKILMKYIYIYILWVSYVHIIQTINYFKIKKKHFIFTKMQNAQKINNLMKFNE